MAANEEDQGNCNARISPPKLRPTFLLKREGNYSLFCLHERNCIRRAAVFIVKSRAFDIFILATIFANCVVLALDAPLPNNDKSSISDELEKSELFFLVIFTTEAILKIIALGFVLHPGSYLRNGWNILDFIVVITGIISLKQISNDSFGDVKPLRAFRVLRPLKLVSGTPSLQVVMKSIIRAMIPLLQVLVLTLFVIVIYAIVGLSFLVNKFHATCFKNGTDEKVPLGETIQPCDFDPSGMFTGRQCNTSNNEVCREYWEGPNQGISTFDNIVLAVLTVSQCITMEGWTDVMYSTFYATDSDGYFYTVYFVSLILIGSYFMLNLVLGVLSGEFAKERERVETRRNFFKLRKEQKVDRQVEQYLEWISRAEEIIVEDLVSRQQDSETEPNQNRTMPADFVFNPINVLAVDGGRVPRINLPERHKRFPSLRLRERLVRIRVRRLVKHEGFFWAVLIIVLLNTISLAMEHYGQPQWLTDFQDKAEIVFVSIFVVEMLLKIYGLGPSMYFRSTFNTFDFVVIIFGVFELFIKESLGISVLRCLRLLRVFKMTSYWAGLRNLVRSLVSSIKSILSLIFLLFLFVVIFALLGMQFFGGKFASNTGSPRTNFDDFPNAMLAVFQILTGEDWNSVMYHGINAYDGAKDPKGLASGLYFVLLVILGNYTLLNVFLAIAVDNLANAHLLTKDEENERLEREAKCDQVSGGSNRKPSSRWRDVGNMTKALSVVKTWGSANPSTDESNCEAAENDVNGTTSNGRTKKELAKNLMRNINKYRKTIGNDEDVEAQQPVPHQFHREASAARRHSEGQAVTRTLKGRKSKVRKLKKKVPIIRTKSLFLFGPENKFRRVCHYIVNLRHFDNFMLVIIICSSILLAVEDPVDDYSTRNKVIRYFDYIFTTIFAFEFFVKLIDLGAVLHPGSYFRSKWNFIDALVVCCNIASLTLSHTQSLSNVSGQYWLKVLRVLRVFRPLKMMNKLKKLEAVFRCMWYSFKNVANILLITFLFLFIFAVIGVQLFQGKFFYCTDPSKMSENDCKGRYFEFSQETDSIDVAQVKDRLWKLRTFHFNDVFSAMLTLYTSATGEGWPSAMQHTMDVTDEDKGPIRNYSVQNALFYISFVVVFSFFFLNIFVALVILTFQEQGEKELVNSELDRNQRDCISFVIRAKPSETFMPADKNTWTYKVWWIVVSKPFELFIMALIILNTIVLMMEYYDQPTDYKNICNYLNAALTFLFTMEAALKLFAFKLSYFRDKWNVFDFIVVIGSIVDTGLTFANKDDQLFDPSMFRIFRAARLIKILKQGASIRVLLWTFFQSFKALPYVTLLIFLVFFIYAVIGMQIFGKIKLDDSTQINKYNNFQNIIHSLLLLFRSSTGENWQVIMLACYDDAKCEKAITQSDTCGSTGWAIAYFCTFIFLCMFFMLNLFVAVIMDNFEYLTRDQSILGPHHLDEFVQIWSVYDPAATGEIHYSKVYEMMTRLSPPVGFGKKCPKMVAYKRLIKMNMPLNEDETIHFTTTLFALVRTSLQIRMTGNMNANDTKLRKMIIEDWPNVLPRVLDKMIPKHSVLSCHQMTVGKIYCAKLMCENYRQNKRRKQFEILENDEFGIQKRESIFRRLVGSMTRSMRQRRASSINGLVPSEDNSSLNTVDGSYRQKPRESLTMEDLKRSSSCHNFSSEKAKRRQELNSSPFGKHAVRHALSASSSPQTSHRKLKATRTINLPVIPFQFKENNDEQVNHDTTRAANLPETSKHNKRKIQFNASSVPHNTFTRPKFQQTPSIVINSPPRNERQALDLTDITLEEHSKPQRENSSAFMPGIERAGGEFSQFNKDSPSSAQRVRQEEFVLNKERDVYEQLPYEKQRENGYEYQIITDGEQETPRLQGNRNISSRVRNLIPRARSGNSGARNVEQSSSDEDRTSSDSQIDNVRTSPGNTERNQGHRLEYTSHDSSDGRNATRPRVIYLGNDASAAENTSNELVNEPHQMQRQSRSESHLKTRNATERSTYPVVKTWSDPTGTPGHRGAPGNPTETFSSASNLSSDNPLRSQRQAYNPARGRANNPSNFSRTPGNRDVELARQPQDPDNLKSISPAADKSSLASKQAHNFNETQRPQGEVFGGLLGESDANHSAEYYDRMISKINEQINLAVSRNKSPYAVYGLGSDDDVDDWC